MSECNKLKEEIMQLAKPSVEDILKAKSFIVSHFEKEVHKLLGNFIKESDVSCPESITISDDIDITNQKDSIARFVRYQLAFAAALWDLIGEGHMLPKFVSPYSFIDQYSGFHIKCKIIRGKGNIVNNSLSFSELGAALPRELIRVYNPASRDSAIWDADLFLRQLNSRIPDKVLESLRYAVVCLHSELYLPAVVMLHRANEKAWHDFAEELLKHAKIQFPNNPKVNGLELVLSEKFLSFSKILWNAREVWSDNSMNGILKSLNVRQAELHNAYVWTDVVRNFRNGVHPNAKQHPLDYGVVSSLLLGAWKHLNVLYAFL